MRQRRGVRLRLGLVASGLGALLSGCSSLEFLNQVSGRPHTDPITVSYGSHSRQRVDVYPVMETRLTSAVKGASIVSPAAAAPAQGRPMVIFFYGGSWNSGSRADYRFVATALNDLGYVVAIPDYRLTPEVLYPEFLHDSAAAVRALIRDAHQFGADPNRIVVAGHSAGAYNAAMIAMDQRWMQDDDRRHIRGLIGFAAPVNFLPIQIPEVQQTFRWPDTPKDSQPIEHVAPGNPPVLLITARGDRVVDPTRNSQSFADRLVQVGVPVQLEVIDGPLGLANHANVVATISPTFQFFAPTLTTIRSFVDQVTR